jgi:hypothetical protein
VRNAVRGNGCRTFTVDEGQFTTGHVNNQQLMAVVDKRHFVLHWRDFERDCPPDVDILYAARRCVGFSRVDLQRLLTEFVAHHHQAIRLAQPVGQAIAHAIAFVYALAPEKLVAGQNVVAGRLNYCTAAGGFEARTVPLDDRARRAAELVANTVGQALDEGFLPAAPADGACRFCDYRVVCGPYEELRSRRKPKAKLAGLRELRNTP